MRDIKRKFFVSLLVIMLFAPSFLFYEIHIKPSQYYSPIPLQSNLPLEKQIYLSDSTPTPNLIQQKLSKSFQTLLKTENSTERITCLVVLNNQPSETIAGQVRLRNINIDKLTLQKTIYSETKKQISSTQDCISDFISSLGGIVLQNYVVLNALLVDIPLQALSTLVESPEIARIEPNYQLTIQLDYSYYIVSNTTSPGWNYTFDGSGIVVAVCDTGIDKTHPSLVGKVISEKSFVPGEPTDDLDGHGTHVAGIIASNNSTYHGIASNVSLVNVKIMDDSGTGDTSKLIAGIEWALNNASIEVINLSAGTTSIPDDGDSSIAKFVDAIVSSYNIVWVNAAGNSGFSGPGLEVPGDALNCISVGNFDDNNNLIPSAWAISGSSSYGPTDDGRIKPDVAAPGQGIISCNADWESGPDFVPMSGTSMATPHVAGAAALLLQYLGINFPSLSSSHALLTKGIFLHTSYDRGDIGPDYHWGFGALDLGSVHNFLQTGDFAVETLVPSYSIAKYSLTVNSSQIINLTLVWNREASTDYINIYYSELADLNLRLENAIDNNPLEYATSLVNNVEYLTYNASAGTYHLYVECNNFLNNDAVKYVLLSDSSLTLLELIHTWTLIEIVILVSVLGIVAIIAIYLTMWYRERKQQPSPSEETPYSEVPTYPEWSEY